MFLFSLIPYFESLAEGGGAEGVASKFYLVNAVWASAFAFISCGAMADQPGKVAEAAVIGYHSERLTLRLSVNLRQLDDDSRRRPMLRQVASVLTQGSSVSRFGRVAPRSNAVAEGAGLVLEDLVALAVGAHPEIAAKRAELGAAKANYDAARWQYFPAPSLQVRQQDKDRNVIVAAIQQPIWSGGRLDAGVGAADFRVRSADVAISEAQYSLALRVVGVWQSWMQARGRAEALARGIELLGVYRESVRQRIKGGISPEVDSELVESRLAQTQGDLAIARATERSALSQLSQIIGRPLGEHELSAVMNAPGQLPVYEVVVEQSVARSAALQRIAADLEAARQDSAQKRAGLWPTVGMRFEYQHGDLTNTGVVTHDNRVMLVMDYVPGAGLSTAAGIDAAEARVNTLRESLEATRRDLVSKIGTDYEEFLSSLNRQENMRRTLKSATEVQASYDRLFVAGKRNWLDVLNAARELTQLETGMADIEAQLSASYFRLRLHGGEFPWQQRGA